MSRSFTLTKTQQGLIAALCLILIVLGFIVYSRIAPDGYFADLKNDLEQIDPTADAAYRDLSGNIVTLRSFRGKPLVINAWASWMPFSQTELPLLDALAARYSDSVTFLAINRMEDEPTVVSYKGYLPDMQHLLLLRDPADTFYKGVGGYAMPETVIYAADGTIVAHFRGTISEAEIVSVLEGILAE